MGIESPLNALNTMGTETKPEESARDSSQRSRWLKVGIFGAILVILFTATRVLPLETWLKDFNEWIAGLGPAGYIVFFITYVIAVVLFLPGSVFTIGAGVVFGLWKGFILISLASTTGAALAFLIARGAGRGWVRSKVGDSGKFAAIDRAVGRKGARIVVLLRLSPLFPFNFLNYGLGLTRVKFWSYVLASWIAMMPGTLLYVFIGYVTRESVTAVAMGADPNTLRFVYLGIGLVATAAVTIYLTRIARRALAEETDIPGKADISKFGTGNTNGD